ncbi:MAG: TolC family protein [Sphingobacteriales bacterium]|nr:TolC family protein [Sphingobacteriales bacterium]
MKRKFDKLFKGLMLFSCLFLAFSQNSKAQESIIPDISYLFLEKLVATAKQNYPRVKQFQFKNQIASLDVKKEKLNWFDVLSFSYVSRPNKTINFIDPSFYSGYQFGININIANILEKPTNVREKKLVYEDTKSQSDEYAISLETEVKRRYFTYIQELNNVKLFTKTLADAGDVLKDLKIRYERGEVTFDTYSQGLITFSNVNKSKIEAEAAFLIAKSSLEELTITKIEDIK